MSTQSLPAASLRTDNLFPAGRVLLWVSKFLIWSTLSSICSSICRVASIFLPALREVRGSGPRGWRAASSAHIVGVLALAQHHSDRGAGEVEFLAQRVDEVTPIGIREICGFRGEECEGRWAGVDLGHVPQTHPAAADERRRVELLSSGEPTIEVGGRHAPVPHLVGGKDGFHHRVEAETGEPRYRDESNTLQLGKRYRYSVAQSLQYRRGFRDRIPLTRREHQCAPLIADRPGDRQVLPLERLQGVEHQDHRFGKADGAQGGGD